MVSRLAKSQPQKYKLLQHGCLSWLCRRGLEQVNLTNNVGFIWLERWVFTLVGVVGEEPELTAQHSSALYTIAVTVDVDDVNSAVSRLAGVSIHKQNVTVFNGVLCAVVHAVTGSGVQPEARATVIRGYPNLKILNRFGLIGQRVLRYCSSRGQGR